MSEIDETTIDTTETEEEDVVEQELTLLDEVVEDLEIELKGSDSNYDRALLVSKVKSAIREVKRERRYPSSYSLDRIDDDLENYYSNIRNIALFDYNQIGAEFQKSSTESSNSRTWFDRDKLFSGIIPLSKK